jgi:hypothetical protein
MRSVSLLVTLLLLVSIAFASIGRLNNLENEMIVKFLNSAFQDGSMFSGKPFFEKMFSMMSKEHLMSVLNREYQYYAFLPTSQTAVIPKQTPQSYSTPCFSSNIISNLQMDQDTFNFTLDISQPVEGTSCKDFYAIATMESIQFHYLDLGTHTFQWNLTNLDDALMWDINTNGLRILRFIETPEDAFFSLGQTVLLFEPEIIGPETPWEFDKMNVDFIRAYANFSFPERIGSPEINLDASQIKSGDFIGVTRMDGLDPMIIWGMGGTTGHTTVALWFDDGLYITESQVNSSYWPTNNIQRTPYLQWIKQAREADYNFVHVPLSDEASAKFNLTAAQNLFYELEGTPYGYHNFLFGWIDTFTGNFPCLPPDYKYCLTPALAMVGSGLFDRLSKALANKMYNQALTHRVNKPWETFNTTAEIYQYAYESLNLTFEELIVLPEQDEWVYSDGRSLVCDVFVCSIWKAAGLFGDVADQIQCTELTPRDVYSMNVFDTNPANRPEICKIIDPSLPFCQLGGKYQLDLPGYGTTAPYANMDQNCPGLAPTYDRPSNC